MSVLTSIITKTLNDCINVSYLIAGVNVVIHTHPRSTVNHTFLTSFLVPKAIDTKKIEIHSQRFEISCLIRGQTNRNIRDGDNK